jgi:aminoglycoside phosphotransferase (APT) family kinase protein
MAPKLPLATEAALMRAAGAAGVPSPHVLHVLEAADGIGTGFIMDHIAGETIARKLLRNDEFAAARRKLPLQVGAILARIHALQPGNLPSADYIRPQGTWRIARSLPPRWPASSGVRTRVPLARRTGAS